MKTVRVVAAAIVQGERVMVAKRHNHLSRGGLWEFPGGKVEPGEADEVALVREIAEEMHVEITVGAYLDEVVHAYDDVTICLVAYACAQIPSAPQLHDHSEVRWLGAEELDALAWAPADVPLLPAIRAHLTAR